MLSAQQNILFVNHHSIFIIYIIYHVSLNIIYHVSLNIIYHVSLNIIYHVSLNIQHFTFNSINSLSACLQSSAGAS
jgi:hypothetical protein